MFCKNCHAYLLWNYTWEEGKKSRKTIYVLNRKNKNNRNYDNDILVGKHGMRTPQEGEEKQKNTVQTIIYS